MDKQKKEMLENILVNTGDLNYKRRIKKIVEYLDIKPGDKVLDCGCGDGFYTMIISELFDCQIYAADNNQKLLDQAAINVRQKERVKFIKDDFEDGIPFEDNFFDKIIFTEVLEHLDNEKVALDELYRVLKPKGRLAITVPHENYPYFWDPLNWIRTKLGLGHFDASSPVLGGVWSFEHRRLYTPEYLRKIVEQSKFKVNELSGLSHHCMPFNLLILYCGKQTYTRLPLPQSLKDDMEKFSWSENNSAKKNRNILIDFVFNLFKKVDAPNEGVNFIGKNSFITVFCGLEK
jgi:ubiquinone/menaquinone biosynthesis C-methylase UbiE